MTTRVSDTSIAQVPYYPAAKAALSAKEVVDKWDWWTPPWLAALVDGEGAVMLSRRGNGDGHARGPYSGWRPRINIYNTDYRLVDAIRKVTGLGRIVYCRRDPVKETHKKVSYYWTVEGDGVRAVAERVLLFSVLKREQLECVIEARVIAERRRYSNCQWTPVENERLFELYSEVRRLNERGEKEGT